MSKCDFIQQWEVEGTVLSPLHIGCGESLDPFKCMYDPENNELCEYDLSAAFRDADEITRKQIENRLNNPIISTENANEVLMLMSDLPWHNHILQRYSIMEDLQGKFKEDWVKTIANHNINLFAHNTLTGERIIPGSSLKGALRTGLVAGKAKGRRFDFSQCRNDIQKAQALEKQSLGYSRIEEDPFGEWFFADAVVDDDSFLYKMKTFHLRDKMTPPIVDIFEVILEDYEEPAFTTTVNHRFREKAKGKFQLKQLIEAVNKNTERAFDEAYDNDLISEYKDDIKTEIESCKRNTDSCIVRMGRFSGYLAMTIEDQRILSRRKAGLRYGKDANPLTRVLTSDGWPLGFVKLKFTPIDC